MYKGKFWLRKGGCAVAMSTMFSCVAAWATDGEDLDAPPLEEDELMYGRRERDTYRENPVAQTRWRRIG